jgi:hypothetical protein
VPDGAKLEHALHRAARAVAPLLAEVGAIHPTLKLEAVAAPLGSGSWRRSGEPGTWAPGRRSPAPLPRLAPGRASPAWPLPTTP